MPTYYSLPVNGARSVVMVYDWIHEQYPPLGKYHPDAFAKQQAVARADKLIAISKTVAEDCLRFAGKRAEVAYCGGGEVFQRPMPDVVDGFKAKYEISRPYVLLVGRRGLYKNAQALYQAWSFFNGAQTHQIIAIGGEEPMPTEAALAARTPAGWRQLRLSDTELASAYAGALALVYPSFHEGFGLPVVEAMACGCPVVCGTLGSLPEVAGDAAFYCDVFRPLSIAAALNAVLDPARKLEQVMKGYEQARKFTWNGMAEVVAGTVRSVI